MEIQVRLKNVYGERKAYPFCEKAKLFARMQGTKTLTWYAMECIKELGYEINVVAEFTKI